MNPPSPEKTRKRGIGKERETRKGTNTNGETSKREIA